MPTSSLHGRSRFASVRIVLTLAAVLGVAGSWGAGAGTGQAAQLDLVIADGRVYDGTGNPWFRADVGVSDGSIVAIGDLSTTPATARIDAGGLVVAPGFIDIHSHADEGRDGLADPEAAAALSLVTQGITTVVVGQDGRCRCPIGERAAEYRARGIGPNVVQLVGHGTIRAEVMGREQRLATGEELERMKALVRQGMEEGAAGMSTGLEYVPGRYSDTREVIELAAVVGEYGGFYISHERSEGRTPMWWLPSMGGRPPDLVDAVLETIEIGEATGIPVVASHIKVKGADYWGTAPTITRLIREARQRGVEVYADQYPYATTGSDGNTVLIPGWALQPPENQRGGGRGARGEGRGGGRGGPDIAAMREALLRRLADPEVAGRIRADIEHEIRRRGGVDRLLVLEAHVPEYEGRTLGDIAAERDEDPVDVAILLQLEGLDRPGGARIRGFSLEAIDIEHYMREDFTATSTDAGIAIHGQGWPHPRFYGTYPRRLRHYAIGAGVGTLAHAIRSATSLPAQIIGLARRGKLLVGQAADVVVLDLEELADHATAMDPHRYSTGVRWVLINGQPVVERGSPTGAKPGRVLDGDELSRRSASRPAARRPAAGAGSRRLAGAAGPGGAAALRRR